MNKIKLFCFPYAGGSSVVFHKWKPYLNSQIELVPVELAGRGRRIRDAFYKDVSEAIEDVFQLIKNEINERPYALFGHSMGAMICYRLAQKIRAEKCPNPLHIFISGRSAPHVKGEDRKKYHLMNDDDFKREVIELGGTPPQCFEHPELLEFFLPLLKNDFRLAETETQDGEIYPLENNITVLFGKNEKFTAEQRQGWMQHTRQRCTIQYFEGGHFFLLEETKRVVNCINNTFFGNTGRA